MEILKLLVCSASSQDEICSHFTKDEEFFGNNIYPLVGDFHGGFSFFNTRHVELWLEGVWHLRVKPKIFPFLESKEGMLDIVPTSRYS